MADLKPVPNRPDTSSTHSQRATTTSFRIPVFWYDKVKEEAERLDFSLSQIYLRALTQYFGTFQDDSWETSGDPEVYDPSRFYTHSQDKKGHGVSLRVKIPTPLAAEISVLTQSGMVPAYRSPNDVVRDAIYHRVKQIARMLDNGELDTAVNMAMLMSDEMKIVSEAQEAEELIDALRTNAHAIYSRGDAGAVTRLKKYLADRRDVADSIQEPYRSDYLAAIEDYEKRITAGKKKPSRKK